MKDYSHLHIGVLALQGAVSEHLQQIEQLGAKASAVKKIAELTNLDGLVLPGGESTAIGKLMHQYGFIEAIKDFASQGKGLFGTCAGMILLAKSLENDPRVHLGLMDITVQRNAFGRQVDSFQTTLEVEGLAEPYPAVFIRAPYIRNIDTAKVTSLASFNGNIVLAKQEKLLACSFHPELTGDNRIMKLFLEMC
ncbi:pyridoxal phosphate synthase yaaE subunit [Bisgaardia hudsonensis]|uniref:Pyridoxal 5'-phosphate synthase subunit PdxT n=1 Tax=Bisgaardia hudsonensis TaxID=109472 RepID=A0A4R2MW74_9PAST|nr:pyridoxal 5'-phosphate synthase glutaminase subunit PdxT [Bisgaardia hudsonensis]QLB12107.1 glutamine amidotransferase subunit PdxT [Bisgaardia hudsonensis]TCP11465.1 pyridoxal phosphate synthase yaaE subunit [Bisgaardia hudsonensis]